MAPNTVPSSVATHAAASPTKIDVSEPLITFFSTSRPHLSPPNGNVGARASAATLATALLLMSAITSASGSTVLLSSAAEPSGAFGAAPPSLRIAASASASGSSTGSSVGLSDAPVSAGALAGSAGPANVGGA